MSDIKKQIAGLKSLIDLVELEANKLADYRVKASSTRARQTLKQLIQSSKKLMDDILNEKRTIGLWGAAPHAEKTIQYQAILEEPPMPILESQQQDDYLYDTIESVKEAGQAAASALEKKKRGRPRKF